MTSRFLIRFMLLMCLATPGLAQSVFSSGLTGIYWNPDLIGWGFSMDIQRGQMFVALFGYDNDGGEAFLTLQSDLVNSNDPFTYSGVVFLTRANGTDTDPVGDFEWRIQRLEGQPSARLDLDSPFIQLDDFQLVRFGYRDSDRLSPIAGKAWAVGFVDDLDAPNLARMGDLLVIGDERANNGGIDVLEVLTTDPELSGIAFFDEPSDLFTIALRDARLPGDVMLLTFVANHQIMSFGVADYIVGVSTLERRSFMAAEASSDIGATKHDPAAEKPRLLDRARHLLNTRRSPDPAPPSHQDR